MIENLLHGHLPPITAYDAIQNVPKCDLAWEFLRRNADYGRDVEGFGSDAIIRDRDWHDIAVFRQVRICATAARWGLIGLCAPNEAAPVQNLFWAMDDAGIAPSVLTVSGNGETAAALIRTKPRFLIDIQNRVTLHLRIGGTAVRLCVSNETPFQHGNDLAFVINHRQALQSVEGMLRALRKMEDPPVWTAQRLSLRDALIAFDRKNAGQCYRDIARQLLGDARVEKEWQIGHTVLKDRIRRAVKRGDRLVGGGYRAFLSPSAPSLDNSSLRRDPDADVAPAYRHPGGVC